MTEAPIFNVAQLLKEPVGATRNGRVNVSLTDLVPDLAKTQEGPEAGTDGLELSLAGPVRLMHTVDGVMVQADLEGEVPVQCARCLEPVTVPIEVPVEEIYRPTLDVVTGQPIRPEEEDQALWIDEHHILDMTEVLRQDVLVALPVHVLCRDDCKGLCPTCGKNLNEGPCECPADTDPRWAVLRDLLNDNGK